MWTFILRKVNCTNFAIVVMKHGLDKDLAGKIKCDQLNNRKSMKHSIFNILQPLQLFCRMPDSVNSTFGYDVTCAVVIAVSCAIVIVFIIIILESVAKVRVLIKKFNYILYLILTSHYLLLTRKKNDDFSTGLQKAEHSKRLQRLKEGKDKVCFSR